MPRCKCINNFNQDGIKDPEITVGMFYNVFGKLSVMGSDVSFITLIGNSGQEIERPSSWFRIFKEKKRM